MYYLNHALFFFGGGGLKNPALHCNDVYMFFLWLKKGGGAKIFVQRIPLRPMFWSFGGFLFTEGARPREELCVFRRCFQKKTTQLTFWPFFLDGENVTLSRFVGDLQGSGMKFGHELNHLASIETQSLEAYMAETFISTRPQHLENKSRKHLRRNLRNLTIWVLNCLNHY